MGADEASIQFPEPTNRLLITQGPIIDGRARAEISAAAQFQPRNLLRHHHLAYPEFHERSTAMAISINSSTSGFRKWSEAQELKKREKTGAGESGGAAASVVDQEVSTSDATLHRPWLVPGVRRL
jgi:hypothetical protein